LEQGVITKKDLKTMKIPKIIYGDAGEKIPFKTSSIDFVFSQTSSYLYKNKLHFFEEVARVLKKGGIARITLPESTAVPEEFQPLLKIFEKGKMISLKKLVKRHKDIKFVKTPRGEAIEIKGGKLDFKAKLESSINLHNLNNKVFGTQSIYYLK